MQRMGNRLMNPARQMTCEHSNRSLVAIMIAAIAICCIGCSSKKYLMPTPTAYTDPDWNPFKDVPPKLQGDTVSILYLTDRAVEEQTEGNWEYGYRRSRSAAYGEAVVKIGEDMSWNDLVKSSRSRTRPKKIEVKLAQTRELGRFAQAPPKLFLTDDELIAFDPRVISEANARVAQQFLEELSDRLARTPRKEVFIYVHGFNNTLEDATTTTAEIWHFLGREGVPICYTWPAGQGLFRAYEYTVSSTEFTIYHFKQALRLIASCPEVEKVHILAHSRGTAVTSDTLRELHLETRSTANTREKFKFGTIVLAAADIDLDVMIARNATERIGQAVEHAAIYISQEDKALSLSAWLFGALRLGEIEFNLFSPEEIEALRQSHHLQFVDARVKKLGSFGHSYFLDNPAVSSDLMLLLRFGLLPGAEHGRPLDVSDTGVWVVDDDYPGEDWIPPASLSSGDSADRTMSTGSDS